MPSALPSGSTTPATLSATAAMILRFTSRCLHQSDMDPGIDDLISLASVRTNALNHQLSTFQDEDEWWRQWMVFALAKVDGTSSTRRISELLHAWTKRHSTSLELNQQCKAFVQALEAQLLARLMKAPEADLVAIVCASSTGKWIPSSEWIDSIIFARASSLSRQSLISLSVHLAKVREVRDATSHHPLSSFAFLTAGKQFCQPSLVKCSGCYSHISFGWHFWQGGIVDALGSGEV